MTPKAVLLMILDLGIAGLFVGLALTASSRFHLVVDCSGVGVFIGLALMWMMPENGGSRA